MSSFIAAGGSSAPRKSLVVKNAVWWPDVDCAALREYHRITDTVTDSRLEAAVLTALAIVNRQLRAWQHQHVTAGAVCLADVPVPDYLPPDAYRVLYLRAVGCEAHAQLIDRYRDYGATGEGTKDAIIKQSIASDCRRDAAYAISEICDRPRSKVVLV